MPTEWPIAITHIDGSHMVGAKRVSEVGFRFARLTLEGSEEMGLLTCSRREAKEICAVLAGVRTFLPIGGRLRPAIADE